MLAAGVAAAPSRDGQDLFRDPHLRERGLFVEVDDPEGGSKDIVGLPFKMSGCEPVFQRAPHLGEHNDYVFREILGLSAREINTLRRDKDSRLTLKQDR